MGDTVELNTKGLDQIIKALKGKLPHVEVGVLGKNTKRSGSEVSNAKIAAFHEYGTKSLPIRSFLRIPIAENLQKYLEKSGAFDKETLRKVISQGSVVEWLKKVGMVAETIVADAFATGGFGKWKPSDMRRKKVHQTLVETQQLRNSISSRVK